MVSGWSRIALFISLAIIAVLSQSGLFYIQAKVDMAKICYISKMSLSTGNYLPFDIANGHLKGKMFSIVNYSSYI